MLTDTFFPFTMVPVDFSSTNHQFDQPNAASHESNQAAAEMEALLKGLEIRPDMQRNVRDAGSANPESRFSYAWFFLVFWLTLIITLILSWQMIV